MSAAGATRARYCAYARVANPSSLGSSAPLARQCGAVSLHGFGGISWELVEHCWGWECSPPQARKFWASHIISDRFCSQNDDFQRENWTQIQKKNKNRKGGFFRVGSLDFKISAARERITRNTFSYATPLIEEDDVPEEYWVIRW